MSDDLEGARQRRNRRRATGRVGAFGPSGAKQDVIDRTMFKVNRAAERRDPAAYWAGQVPLAERITMALDVCALYGPEVDQALGGKEPMVDEWESGIRVPTFEQVQALAKLTGNPVAFFFMTGAPPADMFMCGSDGCTLVPAGEEVREP